MKKTLKFGDVKVRIVLPSYLVVQRAEKSRKIYSRKAFRVMAEN